jgi:radical SAM protein with 4Fe4S-binding SPASM domain
MKTYYHDHLAFIKKDAACMTPWKIAQINPNGDVVPLSRCFNIAMGNVKEAGIKEIWNGRKYRQFRRHLKINRAYPFCSRCCAIF